MALFRGRAGSGRSTPGLAAAAFAALAAAATPLPALAQQVNGLGGVVQSAGSDIAQPFLLFLVAAAYLTGFWLCFGGLWKMAQNADKGFTHEGGWIDGMLRIAGGSLLVALPDVLNMGILTFFQGGEGYQGSISSNAPQSPSDCINSAASSSVVTCVAQNVATNLVPVFVETAFIMFYIVGIAMVFHAIYTLAKSQASGGRGAPQGWLPRVVIGFLICNVPFLMQAIENTLGVGTGEITASGATGLAGMTSVPSLLAYNGAGTGIAAFQQYSQLIGWCFTILVMFGVISVWRGITHLRSFAEGNKQGTMGSGITHIVGGVFLANGKWATCAIVYTFVGGSGLGFCS